MIPLGAIPKIMWEPVDPPFKWFKRDLHVIGDHYLPDGTRLHLVQEDGYCGEVVDNAQVYSESLYNPKESK